MMIQEAIESFIVVAPLLVPQVFNVKGLREKEIRDDDALLTYQIEEPIDFETMLDYIEDQMEFIMLYHHQAISGMKFGHTCCAYSNPKYGHMFKLNIATNADGLCESVDVTVYNSLDYMCDELLQELQVKNKAGEYLYKREDFQVMTDFL